MTSGSLRSRSTGSQHYLNKAREVASELGIDLRLPRTRKWLHPPGTPGLERCDWPWTGAYIGYEGYAMSCCMVSTPDRLNFGNISEQGGEPVWNGAAYEEFRRQLASDTPPEICQSCSIYSGTFWARGLLRRSVTRAYARRAFKQTM